MSDYISTYDYTGKPVSCTRSQWFSHIAAGHEIMKKNKVAVEKTIQAPDIVYRSDSCSHRQVYFKAESSATYTDKLKTKVIVEFDESDHGEIITAFPVKEEKGGIGDVIYSKSNKL